MSEPVLFVWNRGPFANWLKGVKDDETQESKYGVVTSAEGLEEQRRKKPFRDAPLVVLAEWAPSGRLSDFGGLQLVGELFSEPRPVPRLALCSFLSRESLIARLGDNQHGEVLRLPFPFEQLPQTPEALATAAAGARKPTPTLRAWAQHLLSPTPYAKWAHDLGRDARGLPEMRRALARLDAQRRARRLDLGDAFDQAFDEAAEAIRAGDEAPALASTKRLARVLRSLREGPTVDDGETPQAPHSVLVVEDDRSQLQQIQDGLAPYFREILPYENGQEALEILEARAHSEYPVHAVVADWDLREGGKTNGIMQPLQGFELLEEAAALCDGPLVALTDLSAEFVTDIYKAAAPAVRSRIVWFPKWDVGDVSGQDFRAIASYLTRLLWDLDQEHLPSTSPWTKWGLNRIYRRLSQNPDWARRIRSCTELAEDVCDHYGSGLEREDVATSFDLAFNPPSGNSPRTESHLWDRLTARLVVFDLYLQEKAVLARNVKRTLRLLYPEVKESSVGGYLSELGVRRTSDWKVNWEATPRFLHETAWLQDRGHDLSSGPVLDEAGRYALQDLYQEYERTITALHRQGSIEDPEPWLAPVPGLPLQSIATQAELEGYGDQVVDWFAELTRGLSSENDRERRALCEGIAAALAVDPVLWRHFPSWKERLEVSRGGLDCS